MEIKRKRNGHILVTYFDGRTLETRRFVCFEHFSQWLEAKVNSVTQLT